MSIYVFININEFKKLIFSEKKIFLGIILIFIFIFPFNDVNSKIVESQILFNSSIFKFFSFLRYILMCFGIIIFLKLFSSDKLFLTKVKNYYILYAVIIIIDVVIELYWFKYIWIFYLLSRKNASFTNDELIIGYIFSFIIFFHLMMK